ncbi:serine hydrolase [Kocuria rhizosphaericola]|uniref:serine hydrolase n=1 Tax=Kocuria rhizosphaericola TaxID=3376284 RepID=UPI0037AF83C0
MRTSSRGARAGRTAVLGLALALLLGACGGEQGGTTAAPPAETAAVDLARSLEDLAGEVPGELGVVLLDPEGGEVLARNADRPFTSASLYKLFLAHAVLDEADRGALALSDAVPELGLTVEQALDVMISWSDNASGAALGRWLGWKEVEAFAHEQGFTATTFDPGTGSEDVVAMTTTPADVADLLDRLRRGELLSGSSTALLLGFLEEQHLDYALSSGFSPDVGFAHKTGLLQDVSHDAGIVELGGQGYVVAVLTDGWSDYEESAPWFGDAGREIEAYVRGAAAPARPAAAP